MAVPLNGCRGNTYTFKGDHLFGYSAFATELFEGMKGMGRVWQAAATVQAILKPNLLEKAVSPWVRSLFVGFETLNHSNLREQHKYQNLNHDYNAEIRRLREQGVTDLGFPDSSQASQSVVAHSGKGVN